MAPHSAPRKDAMSAHQQTFIIVGASLTGAKAAEALRGRGFDGRVILIGDDVERPYERPPLSKDFLRGEADQPPHVHEAGFYERAGIELRTGATVTGLDHPAREIELESGERLGYDQLLLATGAEPRRIPVEGADLDGVHYLRTLADSTALGERLGEGRRVVVIGAGWIGSEVAASARQKGSEVTVIEMSRVPLERVLGPELGEVYGQIHRDHGVELLTETSVDSVEGERKVEGVRIADGRTVEADLVVVGVGVAPRTELAEDAGLAIDNGVLVDSRLRTSAPGVFAAGDVANAEHPLYGRIRVEHWDNAIHQGEAAAASMLGHDEPYERIPYFFSDQYEVGMEYVGHATEWDEVVFRGDVAAREFIAFWIKDERLVAGMNVNVWDVSDQIRELIHSGRPVERDRLANADVPLHAVAREASGV
jgi:3-phenylpropionate/trans-cinnamate dioxygenase ferredoxin reductase subunit